MSILTAADQIKLQMQPQWDRCFKRAESVVNFLTKKAEKGAAMQAAYAVAMLNIRDDRLGLTVDLAHEIVMGQIERCNQYGAKAYPLSERQIKVIAEAVTK